MFKPKLLAEMRQFIVQVMGRDSLFKDNCQAILTEMDLISVRPRLDLYLSALVNRLAFRKS